MFKDESIQNIFILKKLYGSVVTNLEYIIEYNRY